MSLSGIAIRAAALCCLLQLPLTELLSAFQYFDEILVLVMAICFLTKTARSQPVARIDFLLVALLMGLILEGVVCNIVSGISRSAEIIAQDAFTVVKVFVCFLGAKYLFSARNDCEEVLRWVVMIVRLIVLAGVACLLLAHLGWLDMLTKSTRFGVRCFSFVYGSPGMLSQYCVLFAVVLLADFGLRGKVALKRFFLILLFILWASTLRTRAFVMIVLIAFLCFVVFRPGLYDRFKERGVMRRVTSPVFLVPAALVVFIVAGDQVEHYFGALESARSYLLDGGIRIFFDNLPLGTGFATYGTEAARVEYSPLYIQYGINSHWALGVDGTELTDTFWPAIMAQFGLVGLVLYMPIFCIVLYQIVRGCSRNRELLIAAMTFVAYVVIASTATGVFFSYTITCCVFLMGAIMGVAAPRAQIENPERKGC